MTNRPSQSRPPPKHFNRTRLTFMKQTITSHLKTSLLLFLAATGAAVANCAETFRPPAVPLVACDPYFSIWSPADKLTDTDTTHWTGKAQRLTSLVRIDGKTFRLMGAEPAVLPEDLEVLSRPVTYLTWAAQSTDTQKHAVSVYFDASSELAVNQPDQPVTFQNADVSGLKAWRVGSVEQGVLKKKGDDIRIDWGYFYAAMAKDKRASSTVNSAQAARAGFMADGRLVGPAAEASLQNTARNDSVIAFAVDLGNVQAKAVSCWLMLAYDDLYSIQYMKKNLRPCW